MITDISRAWRETVVTKILIFYQGQSPRHTVFISVKSFLLVNNGNLGAIARSEQWHLNLHCLQMSQNCQCFQNRFVVTTVSRESLDIYEPT